mmetsp:Transcript_79489/g.226967  ORF Transcript_79489/g.226967 Transcript_79489/m.226967 type:complete len:124 (-) Transcript_79489:922-1293(-)
MTASNSDAEHSWLLPPEMLENSPSKADGLDEKTYRRRTAIFIETAGLQLKFPRLTIATAQVFFQRFYALHRCGFSFRSSKIAPHRTTPPDRTRPYLTSRAPFRFRSFRSLAQASKRINGLRSP